MKLTTAKALFFGVAVAGVSFSACDVPVQNPTPAPAAAPSPAPSPSADTGTIGLSLQVAPGVSISTVNWTIHNAALLSADLTGSVDVSQSQSIQFVVGGLPAGDGYTITLTATTDGPNPMNCLGSSTFSIVANQTSSANVTLVCSRGTVADAGNNGSVGIIVTPQIPPLCAQVTNLSASPLQVDVGGSILLSAAGIDGNGSSSTVGFSWAVTGGPGTGTFSDATSSSPTFTCTGAGQVTVTVTATDAGGSACTNNTASQGLTCTATGSSSSGGGSSGGGSTSSSSSSGGSSSGGSTSSSSSSGSSSSGGSTSSSSSSGSSSSGGSTSSSSSSGSSSSGGSTSSSSSSGSSSSGGSTSSSSSSGSSSSGGSTSSSSSSGSSSGGGSSSSSGGGGTDACSPTNPNATTTTCIAQQDKASSPASTKCSACTQANNCLDSAFAGGSCEMVTGNANLLAGTVGDGGPTCDTVVGTAPVTEKRICLQTLDQIYASKCGATLQLTPCLCGTTDPTQCTAGSVTPNGPLYDVYACDFGTASGSTINTDFLLMNFGAGMANSIAQCQGSFGCDCF